VLLKDYGAKFGAMAASRTPRPLAEGAYHLFGFDVLFKRLSEGVSS
jgi:hypothetical protein